MSVQAKDRDFSRIAIIDDEAESRDGFGYAVVDADLEPVPIEGPLGELDDYVEKQPIRRVADAALCDFQLKRRHYATFSGAQLVSRWYRTGFPALLCTKFEKTEIEKIRPHRRWIPVLMTPDELNSISLVAGLKECVRELDGTFRTHRRPWRTQVHFLEEDEDQPGAFFVDIPGWDLAEVLRVRKSDLPPELATAVTTDYRCHARVNLGARSAEEIYIYDWEVR